MGESTMAGQALFGGEHFSTIGTTLAQLFPRVDDNVTTEVGWTLE